MFKSTLSALKLNVPTVFRRSMYVKRKAIPLTWTEPKIEEKVIDLLYDTIKLRDDIQFDLLMDKRDRFGLLMDVINEFEIPVSDAELGPDSYDFKDGRQIVDWVARELKELKRLE